MIRVFIGYDPRQKVTYNVLQQSIIDHASVPVSITPLVLPTLPIERQGLTPFTYSRFLVPYLCNFEGWALFLDADILLTDDIAKLFELKDDRYAVMVSKNNLKFEWASVMLFNCGHSGNRVLTPDYIEVAKSLHQIGWPGADEIGELPPEWNHLVGYDEPNPSAKLIHYTQGIPAFPETASCEHGEVWRKTAKSAMSTLPWEALMGNSIHAQPVYDRLKQQKGHL